VIGVGLVHGDPLAAHSVLAYVGFLGGGLAALLSAGSQPGPPRLVHRVLGALTLGALVGYTVLRDTPPMQALGEGGAERLVVYPVVLFLVVLGTALALPRAATEQPA
jgi:peptidoglycan/LPS O-acetylase OafA/YrhL